MKDESNKEFYIIFSNRSSKPLYGINDLTLVFPSATIATMVADLFFESEKDYYILKIKLK